ncbi:hypothetical protein [Micromonospora eburnea]|uniref:DUF11 domain-containing protein n=1 Tax=Micromonospora eburnea TaxID=227316 RepID=A0A1C6VK57_9ACTN|nr:hypothetical protein [Micromonospora eburnea]SCL66474.1 hypothetical protein GA0070604_5697 [Micromonospora eburnea]
MTERDKILVSDEFAAFREAYAPAVLPAGPGTVRRTVRRRRRRAAVVTAAVVALAVAIPVVANAALVGRSGPSPAPADTGGPTPSVTAPSPTPSPTPSLSPTTPPPSTASATPAAPDGRISRKALLAARVDLAAWSLFKTGYAPKTCVSQGVRLDPGPGTIPESVPVLLGDPKYGDLDGDGAVETVALIGCRFGEPTAKQLVAFDRDTAGRIVTLGWIVGTRPGLENITAFTVEPDGRVRAKVADSQPCCGAPGYWAQQQWQTYSWDGGYFTLTGGRADFGPDPRLTDLAVTPGALVLDPPDESGMRPGTLSVTVRNKGPVDVPELGFAYVNTIGTPAGGDLADCKMESRTSWHACLLGSLPAGRTRTYTFRFLVDPASLGDPKDVKVLHFDSAGRQWNDLDDGDNAVMLQVKP